VDTKMDEQDEDTPLDIGNIVSFEHLNLNVTNAHIADLFYGDCLGLTRDPYRPGGVHTTWYNIGKQQIHCPLEEKDDDDDVEVKSQQLRGVIGLAFRQDVFQGLKSHFELYAKAKQLKGTQVSFNERKWSDFKLRETFKSYQGQTSTYYEASCPWGNRFRLHPANPYLSASLGIVYLEFRVLHDSARHIAAFYRQMLGAKVRLLADGDNRVARVSVGPGQELIFTEIPKSEPQQLEHYDGHHLCIYIANFSQTFKKFKSRKLIWVNPRFSDKADSMETAIRDRAFRFKDIIKMEEKGRVFTLEHEVRSMFHPNYLKPLVNRQDNTLLK